MIQNTARSAVLGIFVMVVTMLAFYDPEKTGSWAILIVAYGWGSTVSVISLLLMSTPRGGRPIDQSGKDREYA